MAKPDLIISLINHSNPDLLLECLRSINRSIHAISYEIWVVDNATDGRLVNEIRREFPAIKWLQNTARKGFSQNHNQVLSTAQGRYFCILNDDIVVHDGAFDALVAFMDAHPDAGIAGVKLIDPDGSVQPCAFRKWSLVTALIDSVHLPGALAGLRRYCIDPSQEGSNPSRVLWVLGACMMVREETLSEIGRLDEKLAPVANNEDVDWCLRAGKAAWEVWYFPRATMLHYGGRSTGVHVRSGVDWMHVELFRTRILLFRKHSGWMAAGVLRILQFMTLPWNALMLTQSLIRGRLGGREYRRMLATAAHAAAISLTRAKRSVFARS